MFNEDGDEVYRWSWNKAFTEALIITTLNKGSKLAFTESWDLRDQHGERVSKGRYRVEVRVMVALDDRGNKKLVNQDELMARQTIELY
ncbi:Intracellular proteinase inhibitor [compost metagenome]